MIRFYELFATQNINKAKALQQAQVEMSRNDAFEHPFFWAPFVLVGGWQ